MAAIDGIRQILATTRRFPASQIIWSVEQGLNRHQISQKLGLRRELSREIRPRSLELLGQVMRLETWQAEHSQLSIKK